MSLQIWESAHFFNIFESNNYPNRLIMYNWQFHQWPNFVYEVQEILPLILEFAEEIGEVSGVIQGFSDDMKQETLLELMLSEAIKTQQLRASTSAQLQDIGVFVQEGAGRSVRYQLNLV